MAILLCASCLFIGSAGAHGGAGTIAVVAEEPVGELGVDYTVEIRYTLDQHLAVPASFVVSGTGPDGTIVESTSLESTDAEGVYRARVDYPVAGDWRLTFQSSLPPGELEHEVVVGSGSTGPETTDTTTSTSETLAPGETTVPPATAPPSSLLPAEPTAVSEGGDGPPGILVWGLIVTAVVFLIGLAAAVWWARRSRDPAGGGKADDPRPGET
jgi:hypothetical protein